MTRRKSLAELKRIFQQSQEAVIHYLIQEIKFLRNHLTVRPKPTEAEKCALARAAKAVDPLYLEKTFNLFSPSALMRWYRDLVRQKWDYSKRRIYVGRPRINQELEQLVLRLALENPNDGYKSLVGRLKILGQETNTETIQNILKRNGITPSPERRDQLSWKEFLEIHWEGLTATDFLTWEVLTPFGLVTYYILFFIRLKDRHVHIVGVTTAPNGDWMRQVARNLTQPDWGWFKTGQILIHDRDTKYTAHFAGILNESGVQTVKLPPESPNLNAYAERFVRTIKEQCLSRMVITSEKQLRKALTEYVEFYHHERSHQGIDNLIPFPRVEDCIGKADGKIVRKQRLGGLLNFYSRVKNAGNTMQDNAEVVA